MRNRIGADTSSGSNLPLLGIHRISDAASVESGGGEWMRLRTGTRLRVRHAFHPRTGSVAGFCRVSWWARVWASRYDLTRASLIVPVKAQVRSRAG